MDKPNAAPAPCLCGRQTCGECRGKAAPAPDAMARAVDSVYAAWRDNDEPAIAAALGRLFATREDAPVAPGMNLELRDKQATNRAGEGKGESSDPHTPAQTPTIYAEPAPSVVACGTCPHPKLCEQQSLCTFRAAAPAAPAEVPEHIKRISIPTETMEQEFARHYDRGYKAGRASVTPAPAAPAPDADGLRALLRRGRSMIVEVAADLATGKWLLSEFREDHEGMVTRATMRKIRGQNEAMRRQAIKLRAAFDALAPLFDTVEQQARELAQVMRERNDANRACLEELTRAERAERDLSAARAAIAAADAMRASMTEEVCADYCATVRSVNEYDRLRAAMGEVPK